MTRERLHLLLGTALLSALGAGCGAGVREGDASPDAGTVTPPDDSGVVDARPPMADAGVACAPVPSTQMCEESVYYPCELPIALADPQAPSREECMVLCAPALDDAGATFFGCFFATGSGSSGGDVAGVRVSCTSCAIGRRPADLVADEPWTGADVVAEALAEMAHIEAASVHAFRRLAHALAELGADAELVARARRAARDEIAHARLVSQLARARGVAPRRVVIDRTRKTTTFELALENAVEGCVHETLGVAFLAHQRLYASDPELRAMAEALYEDELDHATLSWDLVALFARHLATDERDALAQAQSRALAAVIREVRDIDPRVRERLGLPTPHVVAGVVAHLEASLYAAA
jgi:hypothetical protein